MVRIEFHWQLSCLQPPLCDLRPMKYILTDQDKHVMPHIRYPLKNPHSIDIKEPKNLHLNEWTFH
jgi:hypothetical protein